MTKPGLSRRLTLRTRLPPGFASVGFSRGAIAARFIRHRSRAAGGSVLNLRIHPCHMDEFCPKLSQRCGRSDSRKRSIDVLIHNFDERDKVRKEQLSFHCYYFL